MNKSVCFTGHRPEKLASPYSEASPAIARIKQSLYTAINDAIKQGYDTFYTGMARGVDILAADIVLALRNRLPHIKLIAAVPYSGQHDRWSVAWKKRYLSILERCDSIEVLSEDYYNGCLAHRNAFMVQHSQLVIAVYNGSGGGTHSTIKLAQRLGKKVVILNTIDTE